MKFRTRLYAIASASVLCVSSPGVAETISSGGYYPANSDAGLGLETISVDAIEGPEGAKVAYEIKQALDGLTIDGEQWFEIVPADFDPVDAFIRGSADSSSSITELEDKKVTTCAEKDDDGKCVRNKVSYYSCSRYSVTFYPDIEILRPDGSVLYSVRDEDRSSTDYCSDQDSRPSVQRMGDRLIENFASRMRHALAPRFRRSDYRLLERRKGLEKADRKQFKQGLKLTKSDEEAACEVFKGLAENNPQQVSVLFNVGLCHEADGDYALAEDFYRRAWDAEPNKWMTDDALKRIEKQLRAEAQFAQRSEILETRYAEAAEQEPTAELADASE
ncbi:MAG: hypothetical protein QNJ15_02675 [Erythrobacter sp.]|nr:hypothetical protein [Erythrobacter sp.]